MRTKVLSALVFGILSCSTEQTATSERGGIGDPPPGPAGVRAHSAAREPDRNRGRANSSEANANVGWSGVFLQTVGIRHGATGQSTAGDQRFLLPLFPDFDTVRQIVEARASFVDAKGTKHAAIAEQEINQTPAESRLVVRSADVLQADQWYWLVITTDHELKVEDPDLAHKGDWSTHFFTGSAPRIIRLEIPGKAGGYVAVTFSEPIGLETVDPKQLVSGAGASSQCLLKGTSCWAGSGPWKSDIAFVNVGKATLAGELTLGLAGGVVGLSRTAAEGASFSGQGDPAGSGVKVVISSNDVAAGKWTDYSPPPQP